MRSFQEFTESRNRNTSPYDITDDDRDEFSPEQIEKIKSAHFPDTARANFRDINATAKKKKKMSHGNNHGESSHGGSPLGGDMSSGSNSDY